MLVAHTRNLSYLGEEDQKDPSLRSAPANSSQDPISKITRAKWTGSMAQAVQHLLCKCEALYSNPSPTKEKRKEKQNKPTWLELKTRAWLETWPLRYCSL
jgi:hypothetical protein